VYCILILSNKLDLNQETSFYDNNDEEKFYKIGPRTLVVTKVKMDFPAGANFIKLFVINHFLLK